MSACPSRWSNSPGSLCPCSPDRRSRLAGQGSGRSGRRRRASVKPLVADADSADALILADGDDLHLVEREASHPDARRELRSVPPPVRRPVVAEQRHPARHRLGRYRRSRCAARRRPDDRPRPALHRPGGRLCQGPRAVRQADRHYPGGQAHDRLGAGRDRVRPPRGPCRGGRTAASARWPLAPVSPTPRSPRAQRPTSRRAWRCKRTAQWG